MPSRGITSAGLLRLLNPGGAGATVLPFVPSEAGGEANDVSIGSVALGIGMLVVGGLIVAKAKKST